MIRNRYPDWDDQIIEMYRAGYSIRQIAKDVGWSPGFVRNRLLFNEIELRKPGGNRKAKLSSSVLLVTQHMYAVQGKSVDEIAAFHGVTRSTVLRRLDRAGVKRRPPGPASHKRNIRLTS